MDYKNAIQKINSDALNILFECTLYQKQYEFTYYDLLDKLPYHQSTIIGLVIFLNKIGLLDSIMLDLKVDEQKTIQEFTVTSAPVKKRGRKKKNSEKSNHEQLLGNKVVNYNEKFAFPAKNISQEQLNMMWLLNVQNKYLDCLKNMEQRH